MHTSDFKLPDDPGRRDFLRTGFWGAVALSTLSTAALLSGCSSSPLQNGLQLFRQSDVKVLRALVPVVMAGELSGTAAQRAGEVDEAIAALDRFLFATSAAGRKQIHQLFDLLSFPLTRFTLAGLHRDWEQASPAEVEAFLVRWRDSRLQMLRGGYIALTQLINMVWYMQPRTWPAINYVPPRVVA